MRGFLEAIFAPMNSVFEAIPFAAARPLIVGFLVVAALAPLFVSKDFVFRGCTDRRRSRDLRLWAVAAMIPYVLVYLFL
jgi:hypothetical protein